MKNVKNKDINLLDSDIMPNRYPRVKPGGPLDIAGCSGRRPSMTGGNNAMDSDTMPLDTPVKPEYDKAESFSLSPSGPIRASRNDDINSDWMLVSKNDTEQALKSEYDNMISSF